MCQRLVIRLEEHKGGGRGVVVEIDGTRGVCFVGGPSRVNVEGVGLDD